MPDIHSRLVPISLDVILSGVSTSRSEALTQSKDPYTLSLR
jgi:hypothetical protein